MLQCYNATLCACWLHNVQHSPLPHYDCFIAARSALSHTRRVIVVLCMFVCIFVNYRASCYMHCLYFETRCYGDLCGVFKVFSHVAFAENALFKSSSIICWSPLLSLLPDELLMDTRDSNGFPTNLAKNVFITRLTCHWSYCCPQDLLTLYLLTWHMWYILLSNYQFDAVSILVVYRSLQFIATAQCNHSYSACMHYIVY